MATGHKRCSGDANARGAIAVRGNRYPAHTSRRHQTRTIGFTAATDSLTSYVKGSFTHNTDRNELSCRWLFLKVPTRRAINGCVRRQKALLAVVIACWMGRLPACRYQPVMVDDWGNSHSAIGSWLTVRRNTEPDVPAIGSAVIAIIVADYLVILHGFILM